MQNIKSSTINVCNLTKDDFEMMNRKKVDKLKVYETHFSNIFPDVSLVSINDEYLKKRYEEITFTVHSFTNKF